MVKQPGLFSPKFGATSSPVFTRFHAIAAKRRSRTRNSHFGVLVPVFRATTTAVKMAAPALEYFGYQPISSRIRRANVAMDAQNGGPFTPL
jgi:hypothetical protein